MTNQTSNRPKTGFAWLISCVVIVLLIVALARQSKRAPDSDNLISLRAFAGQDATPPAATRYVTKIRRPEGPPVIQLTQADPHGRTGNIACSTCHSVRPASFANRTPADLDEFHQQMPMVHEIRWLLENKRVYVLKEELGTEPAFFYFFDK